ncbi:MAG TPA: 16S rRNA (adenine(1518)-N(6)/adenine(1519)-N(6))-dimethyltransferase RsmA [Chroococcales cyanobacterium]
MSSAGDITRKQLVNEAKSFYAKKRLGQNFLVDPDALARISRALELKDGDQVLEIGPGLGFLTAFLNDAASVSAVELDRECVGYLQGRGHQNLTVYHDDFLRFDLSRFGKGLKVVGNVPYQITTPIICHLFGEIGEPKPWLHNIDTVVLTVQLEVAQRFVASPGSKQYSQISLLTRYFAQPEFLFEVPADSFFPAPKVTSAVVRFTPLKEPAVTCKSPKLLRSVIRAAFSQRRKMLKNNLSFLRCQPEELERVFAELRFDPQARAERLTLEQFAKLADALEEIRSKAK